MKIKLNRYQFQDVFKQSGRENNFSHEGLNALYDYFTDIEDETGEEIELDVIAICCEYTEYKNLKEFQGEYGKKYKSIESIEYVTRVIRIDDESFIIQQF